jgi:type IV secretory pathway VirD2 relaxase
VVVKTRVVRHRPRTARLSAHLAYLRRDGVTRDGEAVRMFDATSDDTDAARFAERCAGDRHHFRFIVSPEDAAELTDLQAYTRDLVREMERDLGTKLEWIAVDHWNTDNPHVHLIVRGVGEEGDALVIHREYISRGMRARAAELATIELGPRSEWDIRSKLAREVDAERWTGLDRAIERAATRAPDNVIDLRPDPGTTGDPRTRALVIGRLQRLEGMGLTRAVGPAQWMLADDAEQTLRALGERGDIIKTMNRALGRTVADPVIHEQAPDRAIVGRVAAKGLHDELTGTGYLAIDGTDGRAHYVRLGAGIDLSEIHEDGIVRVAPARDDRRSSAWVRVLSAFPIETQVEATGATWLDRELVGRDKAELADRGFGAAVSQALDQRIDALVEDGLAVRRGQQVVFARDLLETLERRELDDVVAQIGDESGLVHRRPDDGETVQGVYRRRIDLVSGRFAMVETDDGAFSLLPWRRELGDQIGREVAAVVRGRDVDWTIGRDRGLDIG